MYLLYSILFGLGTIVLLPKFLYEAARHGKYVTGLAQRLGFVPVLERSDNPTIWLHCVSVGETQAARPLVQALRTSFPNHRLVVSTTTVTGQAVARAAFADAAVAIFYFPLDLSWIMRRALRRIQPSTVLIMETELWPNFLRACKRRGIGTAIVNGRLSERSVRGYALVKPFIRRVLNNLDLALMQSSLDADRINKLGLPSARVVVTGNIKFDAAGHELDQQIAAELKARFGLGDDRPLLLLASTHEPEEASLLDAYRIVRKRLPRLRMLIAPRHPERFEQVAELLRASGFDWTRRSHAPQPADQLSSLILLDSVGELRALFGLAELVFVGGSLAPKGGHNVLEPAAEAKCILVGPNTYNFTAIVGVLRAAGGLEVIEDFTASDAAKQLAQQLIELLTNHERRARTGRRAHDVFLLNQGATARTIEMLTPLMQAPAQVGK